MASSDDELFTVYENEEEEDESDSLPLPPNNTSVPEVEEQHEETQQEQQEEFEDVDLSRMDVDELGEAPPPVNHQPPLPAAVMAQPVPPTEDEMILRTQIEEELHQAETHLQGRKVTRAGTALDSVTPNLNQLKTLAIRRIALIQDPAVKAATTTEWRTYYNKQLDEEERVAGLIINAKGPDQTAENEKKAARSKVSRAIKALVNEINLKVTGITKDLESDSKDDQILSRALYSAFKERISKVESLMRPRLDELAEELLQLETEQAQMDLRETEHKTRMENFDTAVTKLFSDLHKVKLDETIVFQPGASSTQNNSVLVQSGSSSANSGFGSRGWKYKNAPLPKFSGDQAKYGKWRTEMQKEVLPGMDDARQIRLISELTPNTEVDDMFTDVASCWAYMDNLYANKAAISKAVLTAFLDKTVMKGHNDQSRLVNLYMELKQLYLTLDTHGLVSQLTDFHPMMNKLISLTPDRYAEEYTTKLQEAEERDEREYSTNERYKFFDAWLEKKHKYLTHNLQHLLTPKVPPSDPPPPRDTETRKQRKARLEQERRDRNQEEVHPPTKSGNAFKTGPGDQDKEENKKKRNSTANQQPPALSDTVMANIKKKWAMYGPCPACGEEGHMFESFRGWAASSSLQDCPKFMNEMSVTQRADFMCKNKKTCIRCVSFTHNTKDCPKLATDWYCRVITDGKMCKGDHSSFLHGVPAGVKLTNNFKKTELSHYNAKPSYDMSEEESDNLERLRRDAMLAVVKHKVGDKECTWLLDGGSTCSLILNRCARKLGLIAKIFNANIRVLTMPDENADLKYYAFTMDTDFGPKKLVLLGMDDLTEVPGYYNVEAAYRLFPHLQPGCLDNPGGEIEILIGQDNADLLPKGGEGPDLVDGLMVQKIPFGPGRVLTGYHPDVVFTNPVLNPVARKAAHHVNISKPSSEEKKELQDVKDIWLNKEAETVNVSHPFSSSGESKSFRANRQQVRQRAEKSYLVFFFLIFCCLSTWVTMLATSYVAKEFMMKFQHDSAGQALSSVELPNLPWDKVKNSNWRTKEKNFVWSRYTRKLIRPEFKLGQVVETFPDRHRVARDMTIKTRSRQSKLEDILEYRPRKFDLRKLSVQKQAVRLPTSELDRLPQPDDTTLMCEDEVRIPDLFTTTPRPQPESSSNPTTEQEDKPTELVVNIFEQGKDLIEERGFRPDGTDTTRYINHLLTRPEVMVVSRQQYTDCQVMETTVNSYSEYKSVFSQDN